MSSLADLPKVVGFFSYSREDDEDSEGMLSALRVRIQRELSAQLGRSRKGFRLWQDQEAIAPGRLWESEIKTAVQQAVFFIPIVTPRAVRSHHCKFEFDAFLVREQELGRADLVFPLLHIRVPALENETQWRSDPVLSIVGLRQYVDWRGLRNRDVREPAVREAIERFCEKIAEALREPWVSPEVRRQQEAEAERQIAEERQRAEAARLAEGRSDGSRRRGWPKRRRNGPRRRGWPKRRRNGPRLPSWPKRRGSARRRRGDRPKQRGGRKKRNGDPRRHARPRRRSEPRQSK
jgi:hypothetical protein